MSASSSHELLGVGIYSIPQASRLTRITPSRLRRWLCGYEFTRDGERHRSSRVIYGELPVIDDAVALSFLDLQEARCLNEFRQRRVGWKALREAHEAAIRELKTQHPFSTGQFKTFGRKIIRDYATEAGDRILLDIARDQTSFAAVLDHYLKGLEFLGNRPTRWFPLAGSKRVVIDPKRGFGRPTVTGYGVSTEVLAQAFKAERAYRKVAAWYDVDEESVRDAVRYERALAAA